MSELFKNEPARAKVREWHDKFRARVVGQPVSREVETRFGKTHVLVAGPENGPPLIALHGALASSAHLLGELGPLIETHRVYGIDVIGQSVMSADARLSVKNDDYGLWLAEVLDGLGLTRVRVLGVSWGGFVAQRFAAIAPERIEKLALLVPAGMVTGSTWEGLVKMGLPMTMFLMSPTPRRLQKFATNLLTTLDDDWLPFIGDAFQSYDLRKMSVPRLSKTEEFAKLSVPVLVIGAEHDVSFPGHAVIERARQLFDKPQQLETELLVGVKHSPPTTDTFRAWLGERVNRFFGASLS